MAINPLGSRAPGAARPRPRAPGDDAHPASGAAAHDAAFRTALAQQQQQGAPSRMALTGGAARPGMPGNATSFVGQPAVTWARNSQAPIVVSADLRWAERTTSMLSIERKTDRRFKHVTLQHPNASTCTVMGRQTDPYTVELVDPTTVDPKEPGQATVLHELRHVGGGVYKPAGQVGQHEKRPDLSFWQVKGDSQSRWKTYTKPGMTLVTVPVSNSDGSRDSGDRASAKGKAEEKPVPVHAWRDEQGRLMLPDPQTGNAVTWLKRREDENRNSNMVYKLVDKAPKADVVVAKAAIDPHDPRWFQENPKRVENLRQRSDRRFISVLCEFAEGRQSQVVGLQTDPYTAHLVDPKNTEQVIHRLRHVGGGVFKPETQVRPGQEKPDFSRWRVQLGSQQHRQQASWNEVLKPTGPVTQVLFRDPGANGRCRLIYAQEYPDGTAVLRDPKSKEAVFRLQKKGREGVYAQAPWHAELERLPGIPVADTDPLTAYARDVHGYDDAAALLADVRVRGRHYRTTVEARGVQRDVYEQVRVYQIPDTGVGLRVIFDANRRPRAVEEPSIEEDAVFHYRIGHSPALQELDARAREYGYDDAAHLWVVIDYYQFLGGSQPWKDGWMQHTVPAKGRDTTMVDLTLFEERPDPDERGTQHTVSGKDGDLTIYEKPRGPDERWTQIRFDPPPSAAPSPGAQTLSSAASSPRAPTPLAETAFPIDVPGGDTLHARAAPSVDAPLHLAQQEEHCVLLVLNMLNWPLLHGLYPLADVDRLQNALIGPVAFKEFLGTLGLTDAERQRRGTRMEFPDAVAYNNAFATLPALQWGSAVVTDNGFALSDTAGTAPRITREAFAGLPAVGITYNPTPHDVGAADADQTALGAHGILIARHDAGYAVYDPLLTRPQILEGATDMHEAVSAFARAHVAAARYPGGDELRQFDLLMPAQTGQKRLRESPGSAASSDGPPATKRPAVSG